MQVYLKVCTYLDPQYCSEAETGRDLECSMLMEAMKIGDSKRIASSKAELDKDIKGYSSSDR
jgi:hypothetical protein